MDMDIEKQLLLGNEAVARAAYEAGATVATAYPGTPSTEITENIAKYGEIYCEWSPNEKVALEVAIGASVAGARAICSMKHVGLNVAADPLFTAAYTGVRGGLVLVVADDPGMHSSQNEQDSRYYGLSSKVPVLEPSDSQECLDYVKEAFNISEAYDTPAIVRLTTRVAHSRSLVAVSGRESRSLPEYAKDFRKYVMMPAMARARQPFIEKRVTALREYAESAAVNSLMAEGDGSGTCGLGIVTSGIAWQYTLEALRNLGLTPGRDIPVLKLGLVHPLPEKLISKFMSRVRRVFVVEELSPFIEAFVKQYGIGAEVIGKAMLPEAGELSVALISGALKSGRLLPELPRQRGDVAGCACRCPEGDMAEGERLTGAEQPESQRSQADLTFRPPVLCPGCPHRSVFYVLKKLKLIVCGDIGCYTLGALSPLNAMDTCVCMGASIGMAHGFDKASGGRLAQRTVAVIGDSTFVHSGITGIIDIVYNKGASTVLILDNEITGMTGHQQNPATGRTIRGEETFRVDVAQLCSALGVKNVRVEDPFDVPALEKAVREETQRPEPSVIVVRRPCALISAYTPVKAVRIDAGKCTRCRQCMGISCAAISAQDGAITINPALCARCGLCSSICRFGAIVPVESTVGGEANG